jgi:hypothetical protein
VTEKVVTYETGRTEPEHQWVECSVRVPSVTPGDGESEVQCLAKVRCDDLIDALDLNRWPAVAFQHLWRSARSRGGRELQLALWYLKRATAGHHTEARSTAKVLRRLVEIADAGDGDLRGLLLQFAADAEAAEFSALELIHTATTTAEH